MVFISSPRRCRKDFPSREGLILSVTNSLIINLLSDAGPGLGLVQAHCTRGGRSLTIRDTLLEPLPHGICQVHGFSAERNAGQAMLTRGLSGALRVAKPGIFNTDHASQFASSHWIGRTDRGKDHNQHGRRGHVDIADSIMRIVRQVLDYQTLSRVCGGAPERRRPLGWLPYFVPHAGRGIMGQSKDATGRRKKTTESKRWEMLLKSAALNDEESGYDEREYLKSPP